MPTTFKNATGQTCISYKKGEEPSQVADLLKADRAAYAAFKAEQDKRHDNMGAILAKIAGLPEGYAFRVSFARWGDLTLTPVKVTAKTAKTVSTATLADITASLKS